MIVKVFPRLKISGQVRGFHWNGFVLDDTTLVLISSWRKLIGQQLRGLLQVC